MAYISYTDALEEFSKTLAIDSYNAHADSILKVDFAMDTQQITTLRNYMPDRVFVLTGKNIENTHPVHAYLTRYCYNDIEKELKGEKSVFEVGTAFTRHNIAMHNCILTSDIRSIARYTQQGINISRHDPSFGYDLINAANHEHSAICNVGSQNCNVVAKIGFSVHVNYDITLQELAQIMVSHGTILFYIYMYLPTSLIDTRLHETIGTKYGFKIREQGNFTTFSLEDKSFVYMHNTETWKSYLTHTIIELTDENQNKQMVTMEIDREWGPLCRIKCVRTIYAEGTLIRHLPNYGFLRQLVALPNLYTYLYREQDTFEDIIIVPQELVNKCINYISRMADDNFRYNVFDAYFNAQCTAVSFDGTVVWQGWKASSPEELRHTVVTLFCLGAANRNDRTKLVSMMMRELGGTIFRKKIKDYRYNRIKTHLFGSVDSRKRKLLHYLSCGYIHYISDAPFTKGLERFTKPYLANLNAQLINLPEQSSRVSVKVKQLARNNKTRSDNINIVLNNSNITNISRAPDPIPQPTIVPSAPIQTTSKTESSTPFNTPNTSEVHNTISIAAPQPSAPPSNFTAITHRNLTYADACDIINTMEYLCNSVEQIEQIRRANSACDNPLPPTIPLNMDDIRLLHEIVAVFHHDLSGYILSKIKKISKCGCHYDPKPDGYCGRNALGYYIRNDLPAWCEATQLIKFALEKANVHLHLIFNGETYSMNITDGTIKFTVAITYDYDVKHFSVPACTCGGGTIIPTIHNENRYPVDVDYWKKYKYSVEIKDPDRVINKFVEVLDGIDKIFEISAAPGIFAKYADERNIDYIGAYYIGKGSLATKYKAKRFYEYNKFKELTIPSGYTVFCDIGDENNLATVADELIEFIGDKPVIIKVFGADIKTTNKISAWLNTYDTIKPSNSIPGNSELYLKRANYDHNNAIGKDIVFNNFINTIHDRGLPLHFKLLEVKKRNIDNYIKSLTNTKLHNEIRKSTISKDVTIPIEYSTGVAGCGKTRNVKLGLNDVLVAPLKKISNGKPTHEVLLHKILAGKCINTLYIDEAFMIPKGWYGAVANTHNVKKMVLLGCPHQIDLVDFDGHFDKDDQIVLTNNWDMDTTQRFGTTTAMLLNKLIGTYLPSTIKANKQDTVKTMGIDIGAIHDIAKTHKVIHFFQEDKKKLQCDSITIHESQGLTFPKVALYINGAEIENQLIRNYRYTYVGMSRHKDELLILYNAQNAPLVFINTINSILEVNMSKGIDLVSDVQIMPTNDRIVQPIVEPTVDTSPQDLATVEEILHKCGFQPNDSSIVTYMNANIPSMPKENKFGDKTKARFRYRNLNPGSTTVTGFRPSTSNFVRHYLPKNAIQTLHTMVTRYAKVAQRGSHKKFTPYFNMIDQLQRGMLKFTAFKTNKAYYEWMTPTFNDLQIHITEYLKTLQAKINPKVYDELNDSFEAIKLSIDFFMKKQPKFMNKPITINTGVSKQLIEKFGLDTLFGSNPHVQDNISTKQKAGQGVSAWPKYMNLIFAAYTRHMMLKLTNMPPREGSALIIGVGRSDQEIGAKIADAKNNNLNIFGFKGDDTFIEWMLRQLTTDFTECDTSHSFVVTMWKCYDMLKMGFPKQVVAHFWHCYIEWRQRVVDDTELTIENVLMQHSGSPDTIHGNTKLTMGANGACYNFTDKGIIKRKKVRDLAQPDCHAYLHLDEDVQDIFGFQLKEDFSNPPEFICNIVTKYGFFPDVVRRCARYISKIYVDKSDFEQTRDNIRDAVAVVTSEEAKAYGLYAAELYYKQHGYNITREEINMLYNYLADDKLEYRDSNQEFIVEVLS